MRTRGDHPPLTVVTPEQPGAFFFDVEFPVEGRGTRFDPRRYGPQTHIRMPLWFCTELGLGTEWTFALQTQTRLSAITLMDRHRPADLPLPLVSLLFPIVFGPSRVQMEARDGMAIVLIDFLEEIDLEDQHGRIKVLLEEVETLETPPMSPALVSINFVS